MIAGDLSAAQRGRLTMQLVPVAMDLACLVRHDGDPDAIGALLASLNAAEREALPVVLAAMVDTERTPQELLGWVCWDENERPLPDGAVMVLADPRHYEPVPVRKQSECGTPWGYERHRKMWEAICDPCREAYNAYQRARRRKRQQEQDESEDVA